MKTLLRQWLCGLRGHDDVVTFEAMRWACRCLECGRETPGFTFDTPAPIPLRSKVVRFRQRLGKRTA